MRLLAAIPLLTVLLAVAPGCGRTAVAPSAEGPEEGVAPRAEEATDRVMAGTVSVQVTHVSGRAVPRQFVEMVDPECAAKHPDGYLDETVVTGAAGELANVFVWIEGIDKKWNFDPPAAFVLKMDGCAYRPHAFTMMTGQDLVLTNCDSVNHSIHSKSRVNDEFNYVLAHGKSSTRKEPYIYREAPFRIKSDISSWMQAWVAVFDHPFHGVTGADGTLKIEDIPVGTYTVKFWHEKGWSVEKVVTVQAEGAESIELQLGE